MQQKPEIYVRNYCGFCYKVMRAIDSLGVDVEVKNIWASEQDMLNLKNATGRTTVPVLRYWDEDGNENWLPESNDIIEYLRAAA